MANILYANNAAGTLAAGITNAATTLTLNAGQAALFPAPTPPQVFYVTLTDAATQSLIEIVKVTAVSGNVFSIVRAQDGTTALSWNANDIVSQRAIRLEMQGWENAAEGLFSAQGVAVAPSSTLGIVGTTTNDNANAGSVGEYQSALGTATTFPNNAPLDAVGITLSAGDWEIQGTLSVNASGGGTIDQLVVGLSSTAATFGPLGNTTTMTATSTADALWILPTPTVRFNFAITTTVFVVAQIAVSGGSNTSQASMKARRVR